MVDSNEPRWVTEGKRLGLLTVRGFGTRPLSAGNASSQMPLRMQSI